VVLLALLLAGLGSGVLLFTVIVLGTAPRASAGSTDRL